jgi:selenocysteine lyase/cysteine desulfurase
MSLSKPIAPKRDEKEVAMNEQYYHAPGVNNYPLEIKNSSRRKFVKQLLGGAAATAIWPSLKFGEWNAPLRTLRESAAELSGIEQDDEYFWELVKEHFPIRKGLIMMNAANLCPSPFVVQQLVFKYTQDIDSDPSFPNRIKFDDIKEEARAAVARYLGADPDEIAITRNTSEGNNTVMSGLSFRKGDEIVIWDENHPTANVAWDVRAQRFGFTVKKVKTPPRPGNAAELLEAFRTALTEQTRVLAFSHLSNLTGVVLPAKGLCRMARERGILTLVDGAQTFGAFSLDLHDMGCDFYTGSAHKWLCGPREVGILYIRKDKIDELWPLMVGDGWEESVKRGARKFETQGQRDDARVAALGKAVEFHNIIGKERIESRLRRLTAAMKNEIRKRISGAEIVTPLDPELSGGIVVFSVPELAAMDLGAVLESLYQKHNIGCNVFPWGIRLSPHIYNIMDEVDKVIDAVKSFKN